MAPEAEAAGAAAVAEVPEAEARSSERDVSGTAAIAAAGAGMPTAFALDAIPVCFCLRAAFVCAARRERDALGLGACPDRAASMALMALASRDADGRRFTGGRFTKSTVTGDELCASAAFRVLASAGSAQVAKAHRTAAARHAAAARLSDLVGCGCKLALSRSESSTFGPGELIPHQVVSLPALPQAKVPTFPRGYRP